MRGRSLGRVVRFKEWKGIGRVGIREVSEEGN